MLVHCKVTPPELCRRYVIYTPWVFLRQREAKFAYSEDNNDDGRDHARTTDLQDDKTIRAGPLDHRTSTIPAGQCLLRYYNHVTKRSYQSLKRAFDGKFLSFPSLIKSNFLAEMQNSVKVSLKHEPYLEGMLVHLYVL